MRIEPEFSSWMKARIGYQSSKVELSERSQGPGTAVRGEFYDITWQRLRSFALYAFIAAVVVRNTTHVATGDFAVGPNLLGGLAIVAYVSSQLGRLRTRRFAWIQFKDSSTGVCRGDILTLQEAVQHVRADATTKWVPSEVLVVAGSNGFEADALDLAHTFGMECYERANSNFVRR
jgi:hypothetical protein